MNSTLRATSVRGARGPAGVEHRVLLEGEPAPVALAGELLQHLRDLRVAVAERAEQTAARGFGERELERGDGRGQVGVDVLEVNVRNPRAVLACERRRIDAADHQVARVQAPAEVSAFQQPFDLRRALDQRARVRVHRHSQTPLADRLVEALEPARQRLQLLAGRAADAPELVGDRGDHQHPAARGSERVGGVEGGGERRGAQLGVEDHRHERGHRAEPVASEGRRSAVGSRGR